MNITQHKIRKIRTRRLVAKGAVVHMCGRDILRKALRKKQDPLERVLNHFKGTGGVHAMIWHDGSIHQFLPWDIQGAHAGVSRKEKRLYRSGAWENLVVRDTLKRWLFKHPGIDNPLDLTGGESPNLSTHGIELAPLLVARPNGEWYTDAQYEALAELLAFLRARSDVEYFQIGHEDTNPLRRWYRKDQKVKYPGGWDPGALKEKPRFRWENIPEIIPGNASNADATDRIAFAVGCFLRRFWR